MTRTPLPLLVGLLLPLAVALALAACTSPAVGDQCTDTCTGHSVCEPVCTCGNSSCITFACVTTNDAGGMLFTDGGYAKSCSQP